MNILGIETSCDETAAAIYSPRGGLLAERVYTQDIHRKWGGVVPELASRDHIRKCLPVISAVLTDAKLTPQQLDGIAYTRGPGLIGALMVGSSVAHGLAYAWQLPILGIHHMEAHIMITCLNDPAPAFPFLALLVSGGHTMLVAVHDVGRYELLGETLDDAVGEAFDKTAKLLGLSYPGGPELAALATQGKPNRFQFPRPMTDRPGLDFSFSGLKTFAVNCFNRNGDDVATKAAIAHAFETAVVDTLAIKCKRAFATTGLQQLVMVGGVSANKTLRERFAAEFAGKVFYPPLKYCTDNGAMIAYTGYLRMRNGQSDTFDQQVKPRWSLVDV